MLQRIKSIFRKPNSFNNTKHIIVPAFVCGGIQYYQFDSLNNLPWKRGAKFLSIYSELESKCDRYYLTEHCKAVDKLFSGSKIGFDEIMKMRQLNAQMQERLKMIFHEDLTYKICSVVYFDKNENPDDWEWKYALTKIDHWKKHSDVLTFFLQEPIRKLIPYLEILKDNIRDYSEAQKALDEIQLTNIYEILYSDRKKNLPNFTERHFWEATSQS